MVNYYDLDLGSRSKVLDLACDLAARKKIVGNQILTGNLILVYVEYRGVRIIEASTWRDKKIQEMNYTILFPNGEESWFPPSRSCLPILNVATSIYNYFQRN